MATREKIYNGVLVAVPTPFVGEKKSVDYDGLKLLIEYYLQAGVAGLVVNGSTGEAELLEPEEREEIIRFTVKTAAGRKPVIAGTSASSTPVALRNTQAAQAAGAQAALIATPSYLKPPDRGILDHYAQIAAATTLDLIPYNIPSRTGRNMSAKLMADIAKIPAVRAIKEGAGDIQQMADLISALKGTGVSVLTGEDTLLLECCALGGDGGIMATAAVIPAELVKLYTLMRERNLAEAQDLNAQLRPKIKAMFIESNPITIKYILHKMFGISADCRPPLCTLSADLHQQINQLFALGGAKAASKAA